MNIIGTINPWNDENFQEKMKKVIDIGIYSFRVNLKTYYKKEHFDYLIQVIDKAKLVNKDITFIFDIGFPRDTTRTIVCNDKEYIKSKGKKYIYRIGYHFALVTQYLLIQS